MLINSLVSVKRKEKNTFGPNNFQGNEKKTSFKLIFYNNYIIGPYSEGIEIILNS